MSDELADLNLVDLEDELCRLPGVIMTRFVKGRREGPLGATLFVAAGTPAEQLQTNVSAVAQHGWSLSRLGGAAIQSDVRATDSAEADRHDDLELESAQQAVITLLAKFKSTTPGGDTVVVTESETVETGPWQSG